MPHVSDHYDYFEYNIPTMLDCWRVIKNQCVLHKLSGDNQRCGVRTIIKALHPEAMIDNLQYDTAVQEVNNLLDDMVSMGWLRYHGWNMWSLGPASLRMLKEFHNEKVERILALELHQQTGLTL